MRTIEEILGNYTEDDKQLVHETIDELCKKGVGNGCFQDYGVLADIVDVLGAFERMI